MSVDKTIEELSYTLAQLGALVGHINSQIGQLASRINSTLDTFDQSVAGIALDANIMSTHVAHTISQVPNGWLFYLLFLTIITVFLLLSIILILSMITRCYHVYKLIMEPSVNNNKKQSGSLMPRAGFAEQEHQHHFVPNGITRPDHVSIPMDMEQEPRRIGFVSNGDLKKRRSPIDGSKRLYQQRSPPFSSAHYNNVQMAITGPFTNGSAEV